MAIQPPTLTPMPNGFYWAQRCHLDTLPTGLFLHREQVASMHQKLDGTRLARLSPEDCDNAPLLIELAPETITGSISYKGHVADRPLPYLRDGK